MRIFASTRSRTTLTLVATLLSITGCGAATSPGAADTAATQVNLVDGWVKATDGPMTSSFGVLHNLGATPAILMGASAADAGLVELHTFVDDGNGNQVMTAVEDGFLIEAGGEFAMEPGGDHIMLMDLAASLEPGQDIEVELVFADESTATVTVPAKDFSGAEENYGDDDHGDH